MVEAGCSIASDVEAGSGLGSELIEIVGLGEGSKLDAGMGSAEGSEMVTGVESAAGNELGRVVGAGAGSGVGLSMRLGFKGCFRGRPLFRGTVGAGLGMGAEMEFVGVASGAGLVVASKVGVALEAGSDVDLESWFMGPDDVGVVGLPELGD